MPTVGGRPTSEPLMSPIRPIPTQGLYSQTFTSPMLGSNRPGLQPFTQTKYYLDGQEISQNAYDFQKFEKPKLALSQQANVANLDVNTYKDPNALRLFLQSQESESASAASYLRRQALFNALL